MADDQWEIRHPHKVGVVSTAPRCGYSDSDLASLAKHGYRLFCNGRPATVLKPRERAQKIGPDRSPNRTEEGGQLKWQM